MSDNDTTQGFIDETDVEGHRSMARDAEPEGARQRSEPDGARQRSEADGPDGARRRDEDDVEGHRSMARDAGPEGLRAGPSTQGEIMRRGPGENPHGD